MSFGAKDPDPAAGRSPAEVQAWLIERAQAHEKQIEALEDAVRVLARKLLETRKGLRRDEWREEVPLIQLVERMRDNPAS